MLYINEDELKGIMEIDQFISGSWHIAIINVLYRATMIISKLQGGPSK